MKRLKWAQDFFRELQQSKMLRTAKVVEIFLSLANRKQFDTRKKEYKKMPARSFANIQLPDGKADNELTNHKTRLAADIGDYATHSKSLYNELALSVANTSSVMLMLSDSLVKNATILKDLAVTHAGIEVR
eukprot:TRINITY_DN4392_c0_g1_i1.p1 TRINITY_DN4392_c0_g1~~TRINITY_DN4392_c0_g1_i1.p1  ORF type:complete len:131 (+),score=35.90 TRINITY_DN4392_c0_g1_i1:846-1238(+)